MARRSSDTKVLLSVVTLVEDSTREQGRGVAWAKTSLQTGHSTHDASLHFCTVRRVEHHWMGTYEVKEAGRAYSTTMRYRHGSCTAAGMLPRCGLSVTTDHAEQQYSASALQSAFTN